MEKSLKKLLLCALCLFNTCIFGGMMHSKAIEDNFDRNAYEYKKDTAYNYTTVLAINGDTLKDSATIAKEAMARKMRIRDSLRKEIEKDVLIYIKKQAPNAHPSIPRSIVEISLTNGFDIPFVMAQTQLETNFGTTGAGRPTSRYSLFGVNGRYQNYDEAFIGYATLLKNNYLVNGKTEKHLLKNYVNKNGHRYGGSNYESKLRKSYEVVMANTKHLQQAQKEYRELEK